MEVKVKLAIAEIEDINVTKTEMAYENLQHTGKKFLENYKDLTPAEIPGVNLARNLFKSIGIDPTKRRPSSESLLRRALKQKGFLTINNLVDTGNWCSLEFLLPICVYDASQIAGRPQARIGYKGEGYTAIDKKHLDLSGRFLVCDENDKPIGSPIKDSYSTRVTENTTKAVLLIYAPSDIEDSILAEYQDVFIERALALCKGNLNYKEINEFTLIKE